MGHWLLVFVEPPATKSNNPPRVSFFDSFALSMDSYSVDMRRYLQGVSGSGNIVSSPYRIQHDDSRSCGLFVLYVAKQLLLAAAPSQLEEIIRTQFSPIDQIANEKRVITYFKTLDYAPVFLKKCSSRLNINRPYCASFREFTNQ